MLKKTLCIVSVVLCIFLTACGNDSSIGGTDGTTIIVEEKGEKAMYEQITPQEAKKIMDSGEEHIILDAREQDATVRFPKMYGGKLYYYCNTHGLFELKI